MRHWVRFPLLASTCLLVAGCHVTTVVNVQVDDDGSGTVDVAVGLDPDAIDSLPDLDESGSSDDGDLRQLVPTDDLAAAGWEITGPQAEGDRLVLRARKPFGTPGEATDVLAELTGTDGPLRNLQVERDTAPGVEHFRFSGVADLSGGLEDFGDEGLAAALEGAPLGEDPAAIEQRFGQPVAEMFALDIRVALPGGHEDTWSPTLGGPPVEMATETTLYDITVLALAAVSALCLVALVTLLLIRRRRRAASQP
jgi:hypothetical protein